MKPAQKKQISMNDLAGMVARGFAGVGQKIDGVEQRLDGVEQRLDGMATKQQLIVFKEDMDNQFVAVNQRLTKVEDRLDEMHEILARFEEGDILDLQNRIKILERTVKAIGKRLL